MIRCGFIPLGGFFPQIGGVGGADNIELTFNKFVAVISRGQRKYMCAVIYIESRRD